MVFLRIRILIVFFFVTTGCTDQNQSQHDQSQPQSNHDGSPNRVTINYAKGFKVEYHKLYKKVSVIKPWQNAKRSFTYYLVPRGTTPPNHITHEKIVWVPVKKIITLSTTYLTQLDTIGELGTLVGVADFKHINSPKVQKLIKAQKIVEIGADMNANIEKIIALEPDVVMAYNVGNAEWDGSSRLEKVGINVVISGSWMESTPLGRSEWIKFIALFYNKEKIAEEFFTSVAKQYESLRSRAQKVHKRPTVFTNALFRNIWYMPGGNNYSAVAMRDAGADYMWKDNTTEGTLRFDFETVYDKCSEADFWINTSTWQTLDDGLAADKKYGHFKAFKEKRLYNNNLRVNEYGGNDIYEGGMTNPHLVLADLIKIFHPDLVPEHSFVWYHQLDYENKP